MSSYKNFVQDFPSRCAEVLRSYEKRAMFQGREVTLMLAIAAAGLTFPLERIREPSSENTPHPSGDRQKYQDAARQIDSMMEGNFLGSVLWGELPESWRAGKLKSAKGAPDNWPEMNNPKVISSDKRMSTILGRMRNALAHGNIYTLSNPISMIVFLSEAQRNTGIFNYLLVSPSDFSKFLRNWFAFIEELHLPEAPAVGTYDIDDDELTGQAVTATR